MLSFQNDYFSGAHPDILSHLVHTNDVPTTGYAQDAFTLSATEKILQECQLPNGAVYLLTGGTQTNQLIIDTLLRPYEGVISPDSGHIAVHEAGAIEWTGHKVITLPAVEGKLTPQSLKHYLHYFFSDPTHSHQVFPGMVYLSQPTELGTLYQLDELQAISHICQQYKLPLFIDGARLIYALESPQNNVSLPQLAQIADVFYIGGTKAGLLCGEAIVFKEKETVPLHFLTQIKQHGALLAKSRLIGVQFDALFSNQLYKKIGQQGIRQALRLKTLFQNSHYPLYIDSFTNQQFVILSPHIYQNMQQWVNMTYWTQLNQDEIVARFVTSWATTDAMMSEFEQHLTAN